MSASDPKPAERAAAERRAQVDAAVLRGQVCKYGTARLGLESSSMAPLMAPGDQFEIRPWKAGDPLLGAVVAFESLGRVVVHAVYRVTNTHIFTAGLGRRWPDAPSPRSALIGIVVGIPRLSRRRRLALRARHLANRARLASPVRRHSR